MKKDAESLQEELDIATMDPKEAHTKFAARVNDFKQVCIGILLQISLA